jgi:hypothetical protein
MYTFFLVASTIVLFLVSRGKWSDAIIDSGTEWIYADSLARGEMLYRDVVYWFGPFTPYFHAAFFKIFGSSFRTLVVAGIAGSLGVLAALYFALRRVTGRREAALWTAFAIPVLVFMPNAGGSILGMGYRMWHAAAFALLAIALAARAPLRERVLTPVGAGALCALAGLCRTEWGLAALVACLSTQFLRRQLELGHGVRKEGAVWKEGALTAGAAVLLFSGVYVLFAEAAGPDAILYDAPVLLFGLPEETRRHVAFAGFRGWSDGLLTLLYSMAMWAGAYLVVEIVSLGRSDPGRVRRRAPLAVLLLLLLGLLFFVGSPEALLFSAAPAICLGSFLLGVCSMGRPRSAAAAGLGLLGIVLSFRRPFHITDGAYVAPPLLFAFCSAAALLHRFLARERRRELRRRLRGGILAALASLTVLAFVARSIHYRADERTPIQGTGGMLSAEPVLGSRLVQVASVIRSCEGRGEGLVVFPEGGILNFLSGRPNPVRYKLYLPGYLTARNEAAVLDELERRKPRVIVIWPRPLGEYGGGVFGEHYGREIRRWIDRSYAPCSGASAEKGPARSRILVAARKQ